MPLAGHSELLGLPVVECVGQSMLLAVAVEQQLVVLVGFLKRRAVEVAESQKWLAIQFAFDDVGP